MSFEVKGYLKIIFTCIYDISLNIYLLNGKGGKNAKSNAFEYGSCLKAFPDEPIQIIKPEAVENNFFKNWFVLIFFNPIYTFIYDIINFFINQAQQNNQPVRYQRLRQQ